MKFYLKRVMENNFPLLYMGLVYKYFKITKKNKNRVANKNSDLCIEGFPRSANSFTVAAFRECSDFELNICTHMHSHSNVIRALKLNIPTLVLIRNPIDSISSLRSLEIETAHINNSKLKFIPLYDYIKWYIDFYSNLMEHRNSFLIVEFNDIVNEFDSVIINFNSKFKTNYKKVSNIEDRVRLGPKKVGRHMFPSEFRNSVKKDISNQLNSPDLQLILEEANFVYKNFLL